VLVGIATETDLIATAFLESDAPDPKTEFENGTDGSEKDGFRGLDEARAR